MKLVFFFFHSPALENKKMPLGSFKTDYSASVMGTCGTD